MPLSAYRSMALRWFSNFLMGRLKSEFLILAAVFGVAIVVIGCRTSVSVRDESSLILATTTSLNDSGLLDELTEIFNEESGISVKVIAVGSGAAIRMGELGNADVLFIHAPKDERDLLQENHVVNRQLVAYNDFIIVGPSDDPAGIGDAPTVNSALIRIADANARFLSRGDDSGTHKKENELWATAGIQPFWEFYWESGQGMGASLNIADQRDAYTLTDRGTFLGLSHLVSLIPLFESDPSLINFYSVLAVNPKKDRINYKAAKIWIDFLLREDIQERIGEFRREEFGRSLFIPSGHLVEKEVLEGIKPSD